MRVALYVRVSTTQQVDKDLPIPTQISALRAFAESNNMVIAEDHIYLDGGKSGTSANREAFQNMILATKRTPSPFNAILVWKFSRFARNRVDSIGYKSLLKKRGVTVISINEPVDDSPSGQLLESLIESIDEFYSKNLGADVLRGMIGNIKQGYWTGGPAPFGYAIEKVNSGSSERSRLVINEDEASVVTWVFNEYLHNRNGIKMIANMLNEKGIPTRKGKGWTASHISNMLHREKYTGVAALNVKGETIRCEGAHEAIVSKEDFEAVQARLRIRGRTHPAVLGSKYLLTGLIKCSRCKGPMIIGHKSHGNGGPTVKVYKCSNYHSKGKTACKGVQIRRDRIEREVLQFLERKFTAGINQSRILGTAKRQVTAFSRASKVKLDALKSQLQDSMSRRERLLKALESGEIEIKEIADRLRELSEQIGQLETALEGEKSENNAQIKIDFEDVKKLFDNFMTWMEEASIQVRREVVALIFEQIRIRPQGKATFVVKDIFKNNLAICSKEVFPCLQNPPAGRFPGATG